MSKEEVLKDIKFLMEDIDKCENELVKAKLTDDLSRLVKAYYQASRLLVQTKQELDFLYGYIACLWKDTQGDELPEIDREVIALVGIPSFEDSTEYVGYKVAFAHRPNPNGYNGKSLTTGKVEHYTPQCYDKGGWNQPNVKYWLDYPLSVEEGGKE